MQMTGWKSTFFQKKGEEKRRKKNSLSPLFMFWKATPAAVHFCLHRSVEIYNLLNKHISRGSDALRGATHKNRIVKTKAISELFIETHLFMF